jgi:hypothetical protein
MHKLYTLILAVLRSVFSDDIGCFPFLASGGKQHETDFQAGYGNSDFSDLLLLDDAYGESDVWAGLDSAGVLKRLRPH